MAGTLLPFQAGQPSPGGLSLPAEPASWGLLTISFKRLLCSELGTHRRVHPVFFLCVCVCVCVCELLSRVGLFATPYTVAHQTHLSMGFSRQEHSRTFSQEAGSHTQSILATTEMIVGIQWLPLSQPEMLSI